MTHTFAFDKIFSFHFNQLNVSSTKIRIHQGALSLYVHVILRVTWHYNVLRTLLERKNEKTQSSFYCWESKDKESYSGSHDRVSRWSQQTYMLALRRKSFGCYQRTTCYSAKWWRRYIFLNVIFSMAHSKLYRERSTNKMAPLASILWEQQH